MEHLKELDGQVGELEQEIQVWHRQNEASCKLAKVPGIGPITASALVASVGDAKNFANGRQMAAWLGLVPRQHSSGGRPTLLGISKRGDSYLRTLLVHGARSVVRYAEGKTNPAADWLRSLLSRRNTNVAVVALANKNAESPGRCWPTDGSSDQITCQREPRRDPTGRAMQDWVKETSR